MKRLMMFGMFMAIMNTSLADAFEAELSKKNTEILLKTIQRELHDIGSVNYYDGSDETAAILVVRNAIQQKRTFFLIFKVLIKELLMTIPKAVSFAVSPEIDISQIIDLDRMTDLNKAREILYNWLISNQIRVGAGKLGETGNLTYVLVCRPLNQKQGEITAVFNSEEILKIAINPGGSYGGAISRPYTQSGKLKPFTLTIKGMGEIERSWKGEETYIWRKTIAGPKVEFSEGEGTKETPYVAKPRIVSDLKIVDPGPYKVGQTITATFSIKNYGNRLIILDVLTVGGRLNGECPDGKCPDFEFRKNILLEPGVFFPYEYKGTLKLERPGLYHFFPAYMTAMLVPKEGLEEGFTKEERWNMAIPRAWGEIAKTIDINVGVEEIQPTDGLATALVMDRSGSMTGEKIRRVKEAAYVYVDTCIEGQDMFSLAAFSSSAESITDPISIVEGREILKKDIFSLSAGGTTNVGAGLTIGLRHLSFSNRTAKKALLMSDGRHNTGTYKPEVAEFQKMGWPISTVAFGRDADQQMLSEIAYQTGGDFFPAESSDIASVYHKINVLAHNGSVFRSYNDFIKTGEKLAYDIPVEPDMKKVGFFTNWQGSSMETILFSPAKTVINRSNIGSYGRFVEGQTHNCFEIDNPQRGTWQALITGYNLPLQGEQVNFHSFCQSDVFSNFLGFQPRYSQNQEVRIGIKLAQVLNGRLSPLNGAQVTAEVKKPSVFLNKLSSDIKRQRLQPANLLEIFREISGSTQKITLFDDGLHQDVNPGDGIYANTYNDTTINGPYLVTIECKGTTLQGIPLDRTLQESFQVGPIEQNSFTVSDFLNLLNQQSSASQSPQLIPGQGKEQPTQELIETFFNQLLKK